MKPKATGTLSGCVVWIITFGMLISCILPVAMIVGGFTSVTRFAMQTLAPLICPEGTTAEPYSYPTTTTDEYGNSQPSTAYEMHCVDENGEVVKKDPGIYAFIWMGILALIGLVISVLLAFVVAAPMGMLITRLLRNRQKTDFAANIEPE